MDPNIPNDMLLDRPEIPDTCGFNISMCDSDFALKGEIAGTCDTDSSAISAPLDSAAEMVDSSQSLKNLTSSQLLQKSTDEGRDSSGSGTIEKEDPFYRGLLTPIPKQYRTDYPTGLHLHKVCTPNHPARRKTVDNYKTQAQASFTPVPSKDSLQKKRASAPGPDGAPIKDSKGDLAVVYEKKCHQAYTRELPPIASVSDEAIIEFLENNNIQMMFEYFLGMSILTLPKDPYKYIAELADKLIKARNDATAFENLPRLLTPVHVESMFRLYDRVGTGIMTLTQYMNAMDALGLVRFNLEPEGYLENQISREVFVTEANAALDELLRSFMFKKIPSNDTC